MTVLEKYQAVLEVLVAAEADGELVEFIESRIEQDQKSREKAAEKRKGAPKKDIAQSPFYAGVREAIVPHVSGEFMTASELVELAGVVDKNGNPVQSMHVSTALRPAVEDGTLIKGQKIVTITNKAGLEEQKSHTAYKLA